MSYGSHDRPIKDMVQNNLFKALEVPSRRPVLLLNSTTCHDAEKLYDGYTIINNGVEEKIAPKLNLSNPLIAVENGNCPFIYDGESFHASEDPKTFKDTHGILQKTFKKFLFVVNTRKFFQDRDPYYRCPNAFSENRLKFHLGDLYSLDLGKIHSHRKRKPKERSYGLINADLCGGFGADFVNWLVQNDLYIDSSTEILCTFCIQTHVRTENYSAEEYKTVVNYEDFFEEADIPSCTKEYPIICYGTHVDSEATVKYKEVANKILTIMDTLGFDIKETFLYNEESAHSQAMISFRMKERDLFWSERFKDYKKVVASEPTGRTLLCEKNIDRFWEVMYSFKKKINSKSYFIKQKYFKKYMQDSKHFTFNTDDVEEPSNVDLLVERMQECVDNGVLKGKAFGGIGSITFPQIKLVDNVLYLGISYINNLIQKNSLGNLIESNNGSDFISFEDFLIGFNGNRNNDIIGKKVNQYRSVLEGLKSITKDVEHSINSMNF